MKTNSSVETWTIEVVGTFVASGALLDIETRKMKAEENFPFKNRWSVMMVGLALDGLIKIVSGEDERTVLSETARELKAAKKIVYSATREFDEMILKGRFTNARAAHLPVAGYPSLPNAEIFEWTNVKNKTKLERSPTDCAGWAIPEAWARGEWEAVAVHNLRDVAEMILLNGYPDSACEAWCRKVLADDKFAAAQFG